MHDPAIGTPAVTEGRGAGEDPTPRPTNQGAAPARRLTPEAIVADLGRPWKPVARRCIIGEPAPGRLMEDGRIVVGWHRTDTSASGARRIFGSVYTDVGIDYTDGTVEYAIVVTEERL